MLFTLFKSLYDAWQREIVWNEVRETARKQGFRIVL